MSEQEWELITAAAPTWAVIVRSVEFIDELQILQVPAANFTAFLTLTLVHVAHFSKSIQAAEDAENWFLLWGGVVSYKLNWLTDRHAAVHRSETTFCNLEVLILTHCI